MRRALAPDHEAAVARRLELLSAELARSQGDDATPPPRLRLASLDEPGGSRGHGLEQRPGDSGAASREAAAPARVLPPTPGRHASRRALSWSAWVPEPLQGRWALGPGQVALLAVAAVVGLVLTCWWLVRSGGHAVPVPTALPSSPAALVTPLTAPGASRPPTPAPAASPGPGSRIVVDVTGRVRTPGIVVLPAGARVVDALRAAGGTRPHSQLGSLNLARVLSDGEQIVVGSPSPVAPPGGSASSGVSGSPVVGLVNVNTADETTLESLPEVGPVTAQAIIAWRTEHGGFTAVSQLLDVDGIGDATLAKLTPYVTI
jgi:competence protein ComEA